MIETNALELGTLFASDVDAYLAKLEAGFSLTGEEIATKFREEDLSGRKADDTGLNKRSGKLYGSVDADIVNAANQARAGDEVVESIIYNTGATYWEYHQFGSGHNPKRLFWEEFFGLEGGDLYSSEADAALNLLAAA
jgi:hypothetical protein